MLFLIIGRDGRDAAAPGRRMAARPAHLERVAPMAADGTLVVGGALLDAAGDMVGSAAVIDVPDEAAARAWIAEDPYAKQGVWQDIEIHPYRIAPLPYRPLPGSL